MNRIFIDSRMDSQCQASLQKMGYRLIPLPPFERLAPPVASHPDMLLFPLDSALLLYEEYYWCNRSLFDSLAYPLAFAEEVVSPLYPQDIRLNAFQLGTLIFGKEKELSRKIIGTVVSVKQGYAKCSTCIVSDTAIITSDSSIAKAALLHSIDVLQISHGSVKLNGYPYGFIGGCSGLLPNHILAFCGDIAQHPDYPAIQSFCQKHSVTPLSLSSTPLYDYGGLILL